MKQSRASGPSAPGVPSAPAPHDITHDVAAAAPDTTLTATGSDLASPSASAPPPPSAPLALHHDPDRYELLGEHGRGGLGRVTRAHDRNLGRDVAIKELIAHSHVAELRFQREALITARLEHPGIVPVHEAGRWPDGTPFYAMKLVAGRPLRDLIAERTTVEARLGLLHHVIAVADALAYAHGRRIIHRDLKPANVIVGDFGETVVIDWGLAKDLGASDDIPGATPSPSPEPSDDMALTSAGTVLGTPAYMAPEQARGEPVDARADVFAIGAMLWELCALAKVPPADLRIRHRLLRKNRIDRDLIAIINKALAADRDDRYPDADALAADLKAFKAGARIASRDYSLLGTLLHWARRHRTVAVAIGIVAATLVIATVLYIHGVTIERDRADAISNGLLLSNAESIIKNDPTTARALLHRYSGPEQQRLAMLETEADAHGNAVLRFHATLDFTTSVFGLPDQTILAYGADHSLVKTTLQGTHRIIARTTAARWEIIYNAAQHLAAYGCGDMSLCALDAVHENLLATIAIPVTPGLAEKFHASDLPDDGKLLAALSDSHRLTIWSIGAPMPPRLLVDRVVPNARTARFIDNQTFILVGTGEHDSLLVHAYQNTVEPAALPLAARSYIWGGATDIDGQRGLMAIAASNGELFIFDTRENRILAHVVGCTGIPWAMTLSRHGSLTAFACEDGDIKQWDFKQDTITILTHYPHRILTLSQSDDEATLYAGTDDGTLITYDADSHLKIIYPIASSGIITLSPPSSRFPFIITLDRSGEVSVLRPGPRPQRIASLHERARLSWAGTGWLAIVGSTTAAVWSREHGIERLPGHRANHPYLKADWNHARFALYGGDGDIEVWSFGPELSMQILHVDEGPLLVLDFGAKNTIVATSENNNLIEIALENGEYHRIERLEQSGLRIVACSATPQLAITTSIGTWMYDGHASRRLDRQPGYRRFLVCSTGATWLAQGSADGQVVLQSVATGWTLPVYRIESTLRGLTFSPDGRELAIVENDQLTLLQAPQAGERVSIRIVGADQALYSLDGAWLAVTCRNGDLGSTGARTDSGCIAPRAPQRSPAVHFHQTARCSPRPTSRATYSCLIRARSAAPAPLLDLHERSAVTLHQRTRWRSTSPSSRHEDTDRD